MGFFKTVLRMNTTRIGEVTGSDFNNCSLGPAKKDGAPALMIYGLGKEDFIFNRGDIKEFSILECNTTLIINQKRYVGNKYRIVFNDGKSALLNVPAGDCAKVESILY